MSMTKEEIQREIEEHSKLMNLNLHERIHLTPYLSAIRVVTGWLYVTAPGVMQFVPESIPQR